MTLQWQENGWSFANLWMCLRWKSKRKPPYLTNYPYSQNSFWSISSSAAKEVFYGMKSYKTLSQLSTRFCFLYVWITRQIVKNLVYRPQRLTKLVTCLSKLSGKLSHRNLLSQRIEQTRSICPKSMEISSRKKSTYSQRMFQLVSLPLQKYMRHLYISLRSSRMNYLVCGRQFVSLSIFAIQF